MKQGTLYTLNLQFFFINATIKLSYTNYKHPVSKENLRLWLHNFLTQRQKTVQVIGTSSTKKLVKSGVPQGVVLGLLLFVSLTPGITEGVTKANLLSYANNTKLFPGISVDANQNYLQQDTSAVCWLAEEKNQSVNR